MFYRPELTNGFALCIAALLCASAHAQTPATASPSGGWKTQLKLGLVGAAGNTSTAAFSFGAQADHHGPVWSLDSKLDFTFTQVERENDVDVHEEWRDFQFHANLRRVLRGPVYTLAKLKGDRRPRSGIDHDHQLGLGLGILALQSHKSLQLALEGGVSHNGAKRVDEATIDHPAIFARTVLTWTLRSGSSLTWDNDLKFGFGDGSHMKSDQELILAAPVAKQFSVNVTFEWRYDSDPPDSFLAYDLKFSTLLAFSW